MQGLTIQEFLDKLYWGDELEFQWQGITYFLQGYANNKTYYLTLDYWTKTDGSEPPHDYLLEINADTRTECRERFLAAPVFKGKTFYEIEAQITVYYG